jgi:alpha-methylacyl-CoA racemase
VSRAEGVAATALVGKAGPLRGVKVVEMAGIGPTAHCGMMLADLGADVIVIDRKGDRGFRLPRPARMDVLRRGRSSVVLDLKSDDGRDCALSLIEHADALIEGFRPGVMERLGLGPAHCFERNSRLCYGRLTGYGQDGPLAQRAGHDLNFVALAGVLDLIGRVGQPPTAPLNLLGDFAGGAMLLAFGLVCAMLEAQSSGQGQVVDAAMVDGVAQLSAAIHGLRAGGAMLGERGTNLLDSGYPFYDVYRCSDGRFLAVGAMETKFRDIFLESLGMADAQLPSVSDPANWAAIKERIASVIATQSSGEWLSRFDGADCCVTLVLTPEEAARHPHAVARSSFLDIEGVVQPAPAPRFDRTSAGIPLPATEPGIDDRAALARWNVSPDLIDRVAFR